MAKVFYNKVCKLMKSGVSFEEAIATVPVRWRDEVRAMIEADINNSYIDNPAF